MGGRLDRTQWYAFVDEAQHLAYPRRDDCIDSADLRDARRAFAAQMPQDCGTHTADFRNVYIENSKRDSKHEYTDAPRKRGAPSHQTVTASDMHADGVDMQRATDWLTLCKAKRLPLTPSAWNGVKTQAAAVGMSPAGDVAHAVASNWAVFKAAWFQHGNATGQRPPLARPSIENATENAKAKAMLFGSREIIDA